MFKADCQGKKLIHTCRLMSKQMERKLNGSAIAKRVLITAPVFIKPDNIVCLDTKDCIANVCPSVKDGLNVFIITSDRPQMKLHVQCINDKVCTIKTKKTTVSIHICY